MLVRMKASISGDRNGAPWPRPGQTIDLPDDEARQLVEISRLADYVDDEPPVETATKPKDAETRPAKNAPKRRGGLTKASSGLNPKE